jgi:hypothetical protein
MERYEKLKDAIKSTKKLNEDEKTNSVKKIEEWIKEDRAFGLIYDELAEYNIAFKEIFKEMGLV